MRLSAVSTALLVVSMATVSWAEPRSQADLDRAKQTWSEGRALYDKGFYTAALERFAEGYRLSGKGGFLFNMAECARMLQDKPRAKDLYGRYLEQNPTGKHRDRAMARCTELGLGSCGSQTSPAPPPVSSPPSAPNVATHPAMPTATAQAAPLSVESKAEVNASEPSRPYYRHWGFWLGVGAAVVAGTVTAVVLATGSDSTPESDYSIDFRQAQIRQAVHAW